jgi:rhomboid protease GluP
MAIALPVTLVAVYAAQFAYSFFTKSGDAIVEWGGLSGQTLAQGRWETIFTSMFLHAGLLHIGANTFFAYIVARPVAMLMGEGVKGALRFVALYLICGVISGLTYVAFHPHGHVPAIGASGALSGLWGALVRIPDAPGPISKPWALRVWRRAAPFVLVNIVAMGALSAADVLPVAWEAHLGGFVSGLLLVGLFMMGRENKIYFVKTKRT